MRARPSFGGRDGLKPPSQISDLVQRDRRAIDAGRYHRSIDSPRACSLIASVYRIRLFFLRAYARRYAGSFKGGAAESGMDGL